MTKLHWINCAHALIIINAIADRIKHVVTNVPCELQMTENSSEPFDSFQRVSVSRLALQKFGEIARRSRMNRS